MGVDELIKKYHLEDQVKAKMNENSNNNYIATNSSDDTDDTINKLTNASYTLFMVAIITTITILVFKYSSGDGFIYNALIGFPKDMATSFINDVIARNIEISEQVQEKLISFLGVYWVTSSLCGWAVATKTFGIGLVQFIFEFVFCPIVSPLIMPIVILVKVISIIKNVIILKYA